VHFPAFIANRPSVYFFKLNQEWIWCPRYAQFAGAVSLIHMKMCIKLVLSGLSKKSGGLTFEVLFIHSSCVKARHKPVIVWENRYPYTGKTNFVNVRDMFLGQKRGVTGKVRGCC
jgi:hypothetical protein